MALHLVTESGSHIANLWHVFTGFRKVASIYRALDNRVLVDEWGLGEVFDEYNK